MASARLSALLLAGAALVASAGASVVRLPVNQQVRGRVPEPPARVVYRAEIAPMSECGSQPIVEVDATEGNPDVYVGTSLPLNASSSRWNGTEIGSDWVAIDPSYGGHLYIMIVSGDSGMPAEFTIGVGACERGNDSSAEISLELGMPISYRGTEEQRYRLEGGTDLASPRYIFSVVPEAGDPDLFVESSNGGNWSSTTGGVDRVLARYEDPGFCAFDCSYSILVKPYESSGAVEYTLTVTLDDDGTNGTYGGNNGTGDYNGTSVTTLDDGMQFWNSIPVGSQARFEVFPGEGDLVVTVTRETGDPDLYVTNSGRFVSDCMDDGDDGHCWSSNQVGSDQVTVEASEVRGSDSFQVTVPCLGDNNAGYGNDACEFSISYTMQGGNGSSGGGGNNSSFAEELVDGESQYGSVEQGSERRYVLQGVSGGDSYATITLSPYSGACEMFVAVDADPYPGGPDTLETRWYQSPQQLSVTLPPVDSCWGGNSSEPCGAFIRVLGAGPTSEACAYTIEASLSQANGSDNGDGYGYGYGYGNSTQVDDIQLWNYMEDGGDLPSGEYRYYVFQQEDSAGARLNIRLTNGAGDGDLFVNVPPHESRPDTASSDYMSSLSGDDTIVIEYVARGPVRIAVFAASTASYTIEVQADAVGSGSGSGNGTAGCAADPNRVEQLRDGFPVRVEVAYNEIRYLILNVPRGHGDMSLEATCMYGNAQIFLARAVNKSDPCDYPTADNYWRSGLGSLRVEARHIFEGQYYVGVLSDSTTSDEINVVYTSSSSEEQVELRDGVPLRGRIDGPYQKRGYRFYAVSNGTDSPDVVARLTPVFGVANLYASTSTPSPGPSSASWSATGGFAKELRITPADPGYCVDCDYFFSVVSIGLNSSYTIEVTEGRAVTLSRGEAAASTIHGQQVQHFVYNVPSNKDIVVRVSTSVRDSRLAILASPVFASSDAFPTKDTAAAHAHVPYDGSASLTVPDGNVCDTASMMCHYKISVVADLVWPSAPSSVAYQIWVE